MSMIYFSALRVNSLPYGSSMPEILKSLDERLAKMEDAVFGKKQYGLNDVLTNDEAQKYLNVCSRTLQNWRDNGVIKFSKVGKKIFYKYSDVLAAIEKQQ